VTALDAFLAGPHRPAGQTRRDARHLRVRPVRPYELSQHLGAPGGQIV